MFRFIDIILLKFFPKFYLGLTRAQDSNDRFLFGSNFIKKNKKENNISVLDVGCGGGNFFAYVKSTAKNANYVGIDFDYEKMKENKFNRFNNFKIISQDLRKDWFFEKFDFVWSSEVIEHLFDDQNFFRKLVKSTKKDGYILITTPYYDSYLSFANKFGWSVKPSEEEIVGHVRLGYNEDDLKKLADQNNLKLENIYFISECDNFRAKNIFRMNNGLFCYFFNILYNLKILKYKRYNLDDDSINKINFFSIAAVYKKEY
jgi:SAM-dependent methyltransferase|tara:strand:+ start:356 stop:1132 length:777 start_codon:yes stop_codon:yes gene_type:complete